MSDRDQVQRDDREALRAPSSSFSALSSSRIAAAPKLAATMRPLREAKREPLIEDYDVLCGTACRRVRFSLRIGERLARNPLAMVNPALPPRRAAAVCCTD